MPYVFNALCLGMPFVLAVPVCLWHLTPAVSRRATHDSRMRQSSHWRGRLQCFVRLVTPWTRPGNRKELLAVIPIAYVLALKRVISFSDLPRGEQFLGRPCGPASLFPLQPCTASQKGIYCSEGLVVAPVGILASCSTNRSAWFTASSVGKACATSGASSTRLVPDR